MLIEELHPCFYHIKDIFTKQRLTELQSLFWDKHTWDELYDGHNNLRHEKYCSLNLTELNEIKTFIENKLQTEIYANTAQLWFDYPGYVNHLHKDRSPNLSVNVQIYLIDSDNKEQGTYLLDTFVKPNGQKIHKWHGIDYVANTGYIMFDPTKYKHGMKNPVKDHRMSLYQSYRTTQEPVDFW